MVSAHGFTLSNDRHSVTSMDTQFAGIKWS